MTIYRFILKSLWYFRKQHLAVFAGTVISTAVLTGALIIGDSVKFSLNKLVETRLGNTKFAMQTGDRFVTAGLAEKLGSHLNINTAPVLGLKGIAINPETGERINSVEVLGVNNSFWQLSNIKDPELREDEIAISKNIADKLKLNNGDEFLLRVQNADLIPLNAPFVSEEIESVAFRLKVLTIADEHNMGRFSLKSNQSAPHNVFVDLDYLSNRIELKGKTNIILTSDNEEGSLSVEELNQAVSENWQLADAGLILHEPAGTNKYELLSDRIFIEKQISESIVNLDFHSETIMTYLVNTIAYKNKTCPYSFITAAGPPFVPSEMNDNEIVINQWLADDLEVFTGDTLDIDYFIIGPLRTLNEEKNSFIVRDIIPTTGKTDNRTLMPAFPGVSDAGSCRDWDTGIPIDLDRIRDKDEEYWNKYRGTPKAYVTEKTGSRLWENKFGNFTAIRFAKESGSLDILDKDILKSFTPEDINLIFSPVLNNGRLAASESVNFGELFLSLSFFVIIAGILLTILIYSLNTESRKNETGILSGLGFNRNLIMRIRIAESVLIAVLGGITGAVAGIIYNYGLLAGLNSVWQDAVRTNILEISINPLTLCKGAVSGIIIAMFTIYFISRIKNRQNIIGLIRDSIFESLIIVNRKTKLTRILVFAGLGGALLLVIYSVLTSVDNNSSLFLSAGGLFIIGTVSLVNLYLAKIGSRNKKKSMSTRQLALRNAGRNRIRSLTIIILLAIGAFTIIITGANRKTFYGEENTRESGTGGFSYWVETTIPLLYDLNTVAGRNNSGLENEDIPDEVKFIQLFSLDGDDASCHNLNQVQNPQIIGLNPEIFDSLKAFSFASLLKQKENPWMELNIDYGEGIIPAIADQTVIQWGLMKSVGDTIFYTDEKGQELKLLLVGGLNSSIFQGNILISEKSFIEHFPSSGGSKIMLVDLNTAKQNDVAEILNTYLIDFGIEIQPATVRLAEFYSVENTYLAVFMFLGGLGVIIGTIGLGVVLLRTILERRKELGLLSAIGFRKSGILKLILIENIYLLFAGLLCGTGAAFIGILPSILSTSFDIPGFLMIVLILAVLVNGIIWIFFPAYFAIKKNLIESLRTE